MKLVKVPEPLKTGAVSFKQKNVSDLFGLGIQETVLAVNESSEEQEGKTLNFLKRNIVLSDDVLYFRVRM